MCWAYKSNIVFVLQPTELNEKVDKNDLENSFFLVFLEKIVFN